jgi:hypothetical protein
MGDFRLDPCLAKDSTFINTLGLCEVRLHHKASNSPFSLSCILKPGYITHKTNLYPIF